MKTDIYILLVQNFFKVKDVEYAVAPGHENISLFPTIELALEAKREAVELVEKIGYHIAGSGVGDDNPFVCYWVRYENDQGKAVVFSIIRKTVEGDLFQY